MGAPEGRPRVVLVGAGHAHVEVLRRWGRASEPGADLALVADRDTAIYSGMVPGFVAGRYRTRDLAIDVARLAERAGGRLVRARATRVDATARAIHLEGRAPLSYDLASLDVGSTVAGADLPGVREHAVATRPIAELVEGLEALLARGRARAPFRLVVVGAGAGGIELACCFRERLRAEGVAQASVILLEAARTLGIGASPRLHRRVLRALGERGIPCRFGARVRAVAEGRIEFADGEALASDALVWAAGAAAHPFLSDGLPVDGRGFVRVRPTFQVVGHDQLFAAGDCAALEAGPPLPKAGVYAVRAGPVLDRNLRARLRGRPLARYQPQRNFLTLLNLGDGTAIGAKWGCAVQGRWVMRWKDRIDRGFVQRYEDA